MPSRYSHTLEPTSHLDDRFLRLPHVLAASGLSKTALYALIRASKFPAPTKLGHRTSVWRASSINAWMAAQGAQQ